MGCRSIANVVNQRQSAIQQGRQADAGCRRGQGLYYDQLPSHRPADKQILMRNDSLFTTTYYILLKIPIARER